MISFHSMTRFNNLLFKIKIVMSVVYLFIDKILLFIILLLILYSTTLLILMIIIFRFVVMLILFVYTIIQCQIFRSLNILELEDMIIHSKQILNTQMNFLKILIKMKFQIAFSRFFARFKSSRD